MHKSVLAVALALLGLVQLATADVTVTTRDGGMSIRGKVLSYEDGTYTIATTIGSLMVDADLVICEGDECPDQRALSRQVSVGGSGFLVANLLPELVRTYGQTMDAHVQRDTADGHAYELASGGQRIAAVSGAAMAPGEAIEALLDGEIDVALLDQPIDRADTALPRTVRDQIEAKLNRMIIAQDGVVPVVSRDNRVRRIGLKQLAEIFAGRITNWSQLGGSASPISLYIPGDDASLIRTFERAVLSPKGLRLSDRVERLADAGTLNAALSANAGGIGLVTSTALDPAQAATLVDDCGLTLRSGRFAIKSEDYPVARRIYLYSAKNPRSKQAQTFIAAARAASSHFAPGTSERFGLAAEASTLGAHGDQLAFAMLDPGQRRELPFMRRFAREVQGAERLSVTFRFAYSSRQLDDKATADASRLLRILSADRFQGREILLVGFADSIGRRAVNRSLSLGRARRVLDEITAQAPLGRRLPRFRTLGFGAAYPVACNGSEEGRRLNRRVEVWVK